MKGIRAFLTVKDNASGATSIEYAMIASFIAMAIVLSVSALGTKLLAAYTKVQAMF